MDRTSLTGKTILLGVSGSIAAYKAAALASRLVQAGCRVHVLLTGAAQHFVGPLTFRSLTGNPVFQDVMQLLPDGRMAHIALAEEADALLVAPATAHTIARLALGLADEPVSATALVSRAPLLIAPAMETGMWTHPATQENLQRLKERGAVVVPPSQGRLASGKEGRGRMAEPEQIVDTLRWVLARQGDLAGRKVVITGGPTREYLDPLRFITNPSSGQTGYALAQAARDRGAHVTHVTSTLSEPELVGVDRATFETAEELSRALAEALPGADVLIMAAAVGDFRPARPEDQKVKRGSGGWTLRLEPTQDLVAGVRQDRLVKVGFAAETEDLVESARRKLEEKGLQLIVANPAPASFGGRESQVTLIDARGEVEELRPLPKTEVAWRILDRVVELLEAGDRAD